MIPYLLGSTKLSQCSTSTVKITAEHVAVEIEPDENVSEMNNEIIVEELTAVEEHITSTTLYKVSSVEESLSLSWKGKPISEMSHLSANCADFPKIIPARNQAILFQVNK